jgi:hypothetical protein
MLWQKVKGSFIACVALIFMASAVYSEEPEDKKEIICWASYHMLENNHSFKDGQEVGFELHKKTNISEPFWILSGLSMSFHDFEDVNGIIRGDLELYKMYMGCRWHMTESLYSKLKLGISYGKDFDNNNRDVLATFWGVAIGARMELANNLSLFAEIGAEQSDIDFISIYPFQFGLGYSF